MAPEPIRSDSHQREAWASPYRRTLVVAGAGAGKTALVVKRVELLVAKGADPTRILLLSFNKDAVMQLIERLNQVPTLNAIEFKVWSRKPAGIAVGTIHSLVYYLNKRLAEKQGRQPLDLAFDEGGAKDSFLTVFRRVYGRWISQQGRKAFEVLWSVLEYRHRKSTGKQRVESLKIKEWHEPPSIPCGDGTMVRSKAERTLVDFFTTSGIPFKYEEPAKLEKYSQPFRPDFYLTEVDAFVEYYGLWDHQDLDLRSEYRASVDYKRKQFDKMGLRDACLELFPDDLYGGGYKVKIGAFIEKRRALKGQISSAMSDAKTVTLRLQDLLSKLLADVSKTMLDNDIDVARAKAGAPGFLHPIYEYAMEVRRVADQEFERLGRTDSAALLERLALEFEADPNWARAFWGNFDYIFIDEFQDVQPALFRFLKPGLEQANFFLIGDDRQAIYRFAGSSPYFIRHLEDYFPGTQRYLLKKNYRSNETVVDLSQQMVPGSQERYRSHKGGKVEAELLWVESEAADAGTVLRYVRQQIGEAELMILSRYRPDSADHAVNSAYRKAKTPKDDFKTCHQAKGLEADAVLITGLIFDSTGRYSFPAMDKDDLPVRLLKQLQMDEPPTAEEDRLFYVALSRAKERLFLVAERRSPSTFVRRLKGLKEVRLSEWVQEQDAKAAGSSGMPLRGG